MISACVSGLYRLETTPMVWFWPNLKNGCNYRISTGINFKLSLNFFKGVTLPKTEKNLYFAKTAQTILINFVIFSVWNKMKLLNEYLKWIPWEIFIQNLWAKILIKTPFFYFCNKRSKIHKFSYCHLKEYWKAIHMVF